MREHVIYVLTHDHIGQHTPNRKERKEKEKEEKWELN